MAAEEQIPPDERRRHQRLSVRFRVDYKVRGSRAVSFTKDLSFGGMALRSPSGLQAGDELDFLVFLDDGEPGPLTLRGRVHEHLRSGREPIARVEFVPGQGTASERLQRYVYERCCERLAQTLAKGRAPATAYTQLAGLQREAGRVTEALQTLRDGLAKHPRTQALYAQLASALADQLLAASPGDPAAFEELAALAAQGLKLGPHEGLSALAVRIESARTEQQQRERAAAEEHQRAEQLARERLEEQARQAAEEQARRAAEEEQRRLAEEQARHEAEEAARREAEEAARRLAVEAAQRAAEAEAERQELRRQLEQQQATMDDERARLAAHLAEADARLTGERQALAKETEDLERARAALAERNEQLDARAVELERQASQAEQQAAALEEQAANLRADRAAWSEERERASDQQAQLQGQLDELQASLDGRLRELERRAVEIQQRAGEVEGREQALQQAHERATADQARAERAQLEARQVQIDVLRHELAESQARQVQLEEQAREAERSRQQLGAERQVKEALARELERLQEQAAEARRLRAGADAHLEQLQEEHQRELDALRAELEVQRGSAVQAVTDGQARALETLRADLLAEQGRALEALRLDLLAERERALDLQRAELTAQYELGLDAQRTALVAEHQVREAEAREALERAVQEHQEQLDASARELESAWQQLAALEARPAPADIEARCERLRQELDETRATLQAELDTARADHEALRGLHAAALAELEQARGVLALAGEDQTRQRADLDRVERELAERQAQLDLRAADLDAREADLSSRSAVHDLQARFERLGEQSAAFGQQLVQVTQADLDQAHAQRDRAQRELEELRGAADREQQEREARARDADLELASQRAEVDRQRQLLGEAEQRLHLQELELVDLRASTRELQAQLQERERQLTEAVAQVERQDGQALAVEQATRASQEALEALRLAHADELAALRLEQREELEQQHQGSARDLAELREQAERDLAELRQALAAQHADERRDLDLELAQAREGSRHELEALQQRVQALEAEQVAITGDAEARLLELSDARSMIADLERRLAGEQLQLTEAQTALELERRKASLMAGGGSPGELQALRQRVESAEARQQHESTRRQQLEAELQQERLQRQQLQAQLALSQQQAARQAQADSALQQLEAQLAALRPAGAAANVEGEETALRAELEQANAALAQAMRQIEQRREDGPPLSGEAELLDAVVPFEATPRSGSRLTLFVAVVGIVAGGVAGALAMRAWFTPGTAIADLTPASADLAAPRPAVAEPTSPAAAESPAAGLPAKDQARVDHGPQGGLQAPEAAAARSPASATAGPTLKPSAPEKPAPPARRPKSKPGGGAPKGKKAKGSTSDDLFDAAF